MANDMSYAKAQIVRPPMAGKIVEAKIVTAKIMTAKIVRTMTGTIGFIVFSCLCALAGDLKIVANRSIRADSISADELRKVFLAEQNTLQDGSHVEPVFERKGPTHEIFVREFLRENTSSLQSHYGALVFTGKALMPKFLNSDAEVLTYVSRTRGAIGYVDAYANSDGVKVLDVIPEGSRSSRALLTRIEPEYPLILRGAGIGGTVRMEITVSPQGKVETVTVLGGNPILGESAMKAVRLWIYAASRSRTTLQISLSFNAAN
jgi:TonB family protein